MNKKIIWANLIHIYQPPHWPKKIIQKVARESYQPIFNALIKRPKAKISLNIQGSLTEQLQAHGFNDLIKKIKYLAARKQVEFTGSAKYHLILPLVPLKEISRQIELNQKINQKIFGSLYRPKGFFLPEMCYNKKVVERVEKLGFEWIILDEISSQGRIGQTSFNQGYQIARLKLKAVFRNRPLSTLFFTGLINSANEFNQAVVKDQRCQDYLITGFDGENLGHHRPGMDKIFCQIIDSNRYQLQTISKLLNHYKKFKVITPRPSSWASTEKELKEKNPYSLWSNPNNPIHRAQWQLTKLTIKAVDQQTNSPRLQQAQTLLDQALASDQYWWASAQPWFEPKIINGGAKNFLKIIKYLNSGPKIKNQASILYRQIVKLTTDWQKSGRAAKLSKKYLAEENKKRYFGGQELL